MSEPELSRSTSIVGGDPANPQCAAHLAAELGQIQRTLAALHERASKLSFFVPSMIDALWHEQDVPYDEAKKAVAPAIQSMEKLRHDLGKAFTEASAARNRIKASGLNPDTRFRWHRPAEVQERISRDRAR